MRDNVKGGALTEVTFYILLMPKKQTYRIKMHMAFGIFYNTAGGPQMSYAMRSLFHRFPWDF
mgnify:CR=1 FL=1